MDDRNRCGGVRFHTPYADAHGTTMEAGRVIGGKYRLRREIGKGAMGSVWAAVHESLGRSVAVKFLRPTGVNPETAAARFVAEARMAARVKHRFVVDIFDFGITEDGKSYMVLELLEGEELGERMYYGPPMLVSDAIRFVCKCLSGLEAVHEAGIVHRDLKPENIFIIRDAEDVFPTLLDFGISKMSGDDLSTGVSLRPPRMGGARPVRLTMPGTVIGTPWYMAPEQLRGLSSIDARADIFAMAVILWEWLVGRVPYDHDNIGDLYMNLVRGGAPDLNRVRPDLTRALAQVLSTAMATRPTDRYQSAREMRKALAPLADAVPQAWTVVQKSIANMSSAEVLGVHFPGDRPGASGEGAQSTSAASQVPLAADDPVAAPAAAGIASRDDECTEAVTLPPRGGDATPAGPASLPVPPPAPGTAAGQRAGWFARAIRSVRVRLAPPVAAVARHLAPAMAKLSGWIEAAGLSAERSRALRQQWHALARRRRMWGAVWLGALLLIVVAVFSGDGEPAARRGIGGEPLLTSAAAQSSAADTVVDGADAPRVPGGALEPAAKGASKPSAAPGSAATEANTATPTTAGQALGESVSKPDAGAPAAAPAPENTPPKRPRRKIRPRRPRLIRSLDF